MATYISFIAPMMKAILEGRKTMTRRVVKAEPYDACDDGIDILFATDSLNCPYGQLGDRLLVKEAAWVWCHKEVNGLTATGRTKYAYKPVGQHVLYAADHPAKPTAPVDDHPCHCWRFKIPRYLPRWACRLVLEITDVRVERLQELSEADARAEGATPVPCGACGEIDPQWICVGCRHPFYRKGFAALWDDLNAGRGFGWEDNPWVWAITFRKVRG